MEAVYYCGSERGLVNTAEVQLGVTSIVVSTEIEQRMQYGESSHVLRRCWPDLLLPMELPLWLK